MQIRQTISVIALFATLMTGCTLGFKSWPQPKAAQDKFAWHSVTLQLAGDSLVIEGRLTGSFENFQYVRVFVEPLGPDSCDQCPFNPVITKEYRPGDPGFELVGPWMKVQLGGLDTAIAYRVQLVGTNRLDGLADVQSTIERIDPS